MKILVVGLVNNDQLKRVVDEGANRNHKIDGCYTSDLVVYSTNDIFEPSLKAKSFEEYDLIYLWTVGKRRWEWYTAMDYLNKKFGKIIVNKVVIDPKENYSPTPLISFWKQYENKLPFPKSALVFSEKSVESVIDRFEFPVIVKASTTHQGKGVFLANTKGEIKKIIKENEVMSPSFIIREFIPNDGDIRIFTVGYRAIGAMKRTPVKDGEFRSNISLGGKGERFDLEKYPEVQSIAEKASEITGTEIAGVDIMLDKNTGKPYILEVNPGPQFTGFEKYTGVNAAEEIIKYFEKLYNSRK
jgi:RimK family alpha-L-glutamate ligase